MANGPQAASIALRVLELIMSIILLGLSAGFTADIREARVIYNLVASVISVTYLGYVGAFVPIFFNYNSPSWIILIMEILNFVLLLSSWAVVASDFPTDCPTNSWGKQNCQIYQTMLAFGIMDWLLYTFSMSFFIGYSYVPEIREYGFFHQFRFTDYYWGCIFVDPHSGLRLRHCFGWRIFDWSDGKDMERVVANSHGQPEINVGGVGVGGAGGVAGVGSVGAPGAAGVKSADSQQANSPASKAAVTAATSTH
ncbi:uncharacterized protein LODBEIA_P54490 [Lodderomyces beijingensis]|uniref:MARVEL domain-containing protein n=1 Tax=Lodderomyces beijingensis TaxID=1775926 RepID=A0ABP0ZVB0_9ASCO